MKEFTVESMVEACECYVDVKDRHYMFDVFRKMSFHGFISLELFDEFCDAWSEKELYK